MSSIENDETFISNNNNEIALRTVSLLENIEISHEFGDGSSISRFKDAINSENFWNTLLQKDFVEFIQ